MIFFQHRSLLVKALSNNPFNASANSVAFIAGHALTPRLVPPGQSGRQAFVE